MTKVVNYCLLDYINHILSKFIKKYKCDKLQLYTLLKSESKNAYLLDKQHNKATILFCNQ